MDVEWPTIIQGGIPLLGGLFATALGFELVHLPGIHPSVSKRLFLHLRWLGPLVALFGLYSGWESHVRLAQPNAAEVARQLASRMTLPMRIDEITKLESVEGSGSTVTFHASLATTLRSQDERERATGIFRNQAISLGCSDAQTVQVLNAGYTIERRYRFEDGYEIVATLSRESCPH